MSESSIGIPSGQTHGVAQDSPEFLLSGAGLFYLASLVAIVGRVAITFLIAQALGASALGVYTLAFATLQVLTMLAINGQDIGLVRFSSPAHLAQDRAQLRSLVDAALVMGTLASVLGSVAMLVLFPFFAATAPDAPQLALFFMPAILPGVLSTLLGSFGLACGRTRARAIPDKIVGTLVQLGMTFLAVSLGWGLRGVALALVANNVASLVASALFVWDLYPSSTPAAPRRRTARTLLGYSWKLGLSNASGYVLVNAALFVLGFLDAAQAGLYAAASRLTFPGLIFFESFGAVFGPQAARKLNDPSLKHDLQRVTNWMIVCSAPVFILLFVFADTWMSLLGPEFTAGAPILRLMALAQMLNMFTGGASVLVGIANRPGLKVVNTMVSWGLNLALVLWLAPQWGALGAAYAYLAAVIVIDVLEYSEVRFLIRLSPFGKILIKPLVLIGVLALALLLISRGITMSLWGVAALTLLFLVSYVVMMLRLGLPAADVRAVGSLAHHLRSGVRR